MKCMLVITNITKDEAKEMVESQFGSVMWGAEMDELTLSTVSRSYPTSDAVATVMLMDRTRASSGGAHVSEWKKDE